MNPLMVMNLTKVYGSYIKEGLVAVRDLTFGVDRGQCFGLLGVNGAGKTTTFKMLTGEISPTFGNAWINQFSIISAMDDARRNIGYCPQFDSLNLKLTGSEHLTLYCTLKGLDTESTAKVLFLFFFLLFPSAFPLVYSQPVTSCSSSMLIGASKGSGCLRMATVLPKLTQEATRESCQRQSLWLEIHR